VSASSAAPGQRATRSLSERIDELAAGTPGSPAFLGAEALTWSGYAERARSLAGLLVALGLEPGERVGVLLPDGPGVHAAFVAGELAGLVVVGIGPRAGPLEIRHLLGHTRASGLVSRARQGELDLVALARELRAQGLPLRHHLVVEAELAPGDALAVDGGPAPAPDPEAARAAIRARRLGPDDLFLLNSTSGTTGLPRCVTHDQSRWLHFHELAVEAGELSPADVFMSVVSAPFGFGIWTSHVTPALLGAPTVLLPRFDAAGALAAIERHRVSVLAAVSTQFVMMLNSPAMGRHDLTSLRVLFTGGEAVPPARAAEFEDRTGAKVLQFYGSNETGALSRTTTRDPRELRLATAGRVIPGMQVRLFDPEGRDCTATGRGIPGCRGPLTSRGYFEDAEGNRRLFTPDGWMLTGDVATLDAQGYLRVVGRTADFIIRGGRNVSAPAVEGAVATHPAVALAAAVAMPDEVFGERVCVYAELRAGSSLSLAGLVAHLRAQGVSPETLPERLVVVDELPRASGGKIAKHALSEDIRRRIAEEKARA
jgi:acyl-CoA synthetase